MKRVILLAGLLAMVLSFAGCVVSVGSRIQASPATVAVTDDADKATVAEIDAAAELNIDNRRALALDHIAQRPSLSIPVQLHLVNVTYRSLTIDNNKAGVLTKIIARPDFGDAVRHSIVSQLSNLTIEANRQYILDQINTRQQHAKMPAPPAAPAASSTSAPAAVAVVVASQGAADSPAVHTNTAIIPVPRADDRSRARQDLVLQRAKDNPGPCDIAFIGDSITQGWEGAGRTVWTNYYGKRNCLNFGVGGDRTQHVLWRFEHGQLDGIKPKVAVLMIGTNNSNRDDNTETDILEGLQAIVKQFRTRLPDTKLIVLGIFPRGKTFSTQRGKILQVNQALEKLADGKMIFYLDFGSQMIEADGSISTDMMRDALHPGEKGYEIWAAATEPKLKELLGN